MARLGLAIAALAGALCSGKAMANGPVDADSRAWWEITAELSGDEMEGRDAGSSGHERAARLVAERMEAAGLKPLGDDDSWYQRIALEEVAVTDATFKAGHQTLVFLEDFTVTANPGLPAEVTGLLAYRGYCGAETLGDVTGRLVICHGTRREGLPSGTDRYEALRAAGAAGMIEIADPGFAIEPPRWPFAYARRITRAGEMDTPGEFIDITLNAKALGKLLPRVDAAELVAKGAAGQPLPSFDAGSATLTFRTKSAQFTSPNVIGMLPGADPAKADEAIVLGAHLDGYGFGHAVDGDPLYNGTLDDAAYVALLLHLAEMRDGKGYDRPVIFAVWTGEEKGLHGSRWFVDHPTIPLSRIAANINLDQLRPIFPLELMTVHARTDTTLGDDATAVATAMGVEVQDDPEPERRLLRRSDHWNFLSRGIPAVNFVFGYKPGSESEAIYRQWYRTGYHKPQDDLQQPMDWQAAADFNRFFYALVERVANNPAAPAWKPDSALRATLSPEG